MLIRDEVTQGGALSMVILCLSLSVLGNQIQGEYPRYIQSWYADDFSTEVTRPNIKHAIDCIEALGSAGGLFFKKEKSQFVWFPGVS